MICSTASGQSTAVLQGRVVDKVSDVVVGAKITLSNKATGIEWNTLTDGQGNYQVASVPVGTYRVQIEASGFQIHVVDDLHVEVAQTLVQDFRLSVGSISQTINVKPEGPLIDRGTTSVGHIVNQ